MGSASLSWWIRSAQLGRPGPAMTHSRSRPDDAQQVAREDVQEAGGPPEEGLAVVLAFERDGQDEPVPRPGERDVGEPSLLGEPARLAERAAVRQEALG